MADKEPTALAADCLLALRLLYASASATSLGDCCYVTMNVQLASCFPLTLMFVTDILGTLLTPHDQVICSCCGGIRNPLKL